MSDHGITVKVKKNHIELAASIIKLKVCKKCKTTNKYVRSSCAGCGKSFKKRLSR